MDSVARRRSARTARVASAPATSSPPGLGWRPWASLLCHSAVRLARRCARCAGVAWADAPRVWRRVASQLLVVFATVWLWHFVSPSAASLPGYKGFGRFARARARCALRATRPMSTPALARALTRARARSSSPSAASPGSSSCGRSQSSQTWCAPADALFPASTTTLLPCPSLFAPRCASDPSRASFPRQATLLRRAGGAGCTLSAALDDAACAALPIATAVTMLYYALLTANPGFVEEPCVPFWLTV